MDAVRRWPGEAPVPRHARHLVLLHQELKALHVLRDNRVLAPLYRCPIQAWRRAPGKVQPKLRSMLHVVPDLGIEEQRLGRNAADVQAGSAQLLLFFNERHRQPKLRRAKRRGIPARPAANDCYIVKCLCNRVYLCQGCSIPGAPQTAVEQPIPSFSLMDAWRLRASSVTDSQHLGAISQTRNATNSRAIRCTPASSPKE